MFSEKTIGTARQHFADIQTRCIAEAQSGAFRVNDLPRYVAQCEADRAAILAGKWDHTFTFRQYAHYLQTGECVGLLGNGTR